MLRTDPGGFRERGKRGGTLMRRAVAGCTALALTVGLAACGSGGSSSSTSSGTSASTGGTVHIYSSLPLLGASTAQTKPMVNGIKLALDEAGNKAGNFDVEYTSL